MSDDQTIKIIYGPEPGREGEYPTCYGVGQRGPAGGTVTRIVRVDERMGDHYEGWLDVFEGDVRTLRWNARYVAEIFYDVTPAAEAKS